MGPEPSYKWNLNPYQWGDWGITPINGVVGPQPFFGPILKRFLSKFLLAHIEAETGYMTPDALPPNWNFPLRTSASSVNGSNAAFRWDGRYLEPWVVPGNALKMKFRGEVNMNEQTTHPPPKKNNWTVASAFFCCWLPLLQLKRKDLLLVQWSFLWRFYMFNLLYRTFTTSSNYC